MKFYKYNDILYRLMYVILMSMGMLFAVHKYIGLDEIGISEYAVIGICLAISVLFGKVNKAVKIAMVLSIPIATLFYLLIKGKEKLVFVCYERRHLFYIAGFVIIACLIVMFFEKIPVMRIIIAILIAVYSCVLMYSQIMSEKILVASIITLELILVCDIINKKRLVSTLIPFWIIFFIAIVLSKSSPKPYEWKQVKTAYYTIKNEVKNIAQSIMNSGADDFIYSMSGYGESNKIGDKVSKSSQELMVVTCDKKMPCNLYLAGNYLDEFDGREWKESDGNIESDKMRIIDSLETMYAIDNIDNKLFENMIVKNYLQTEYRNFHTSHTFTTSKAIVQEPDKYHKKSYGDVINSTCFQIYAGKDGLCELIENRQPDSEKTWLNTCNKYAVRDVSYSDYVDYKNVVYDKYLKETVLENEVKEWVDGVTKNAVTKEDRLFCIQDAMRKFSYTTDVDPHLSEIKNSNDFLDYFLLKKQEGYCTYYATAFVILARAEGYPARYAQGFYVPIKGRYSSTVNGKMAHAWAEVYFDGIGWIPFENTPSYEGVAFEHVDYSLTGSKALELPESELNAEEAENDMADEEIDVEKEETKIFLRFAFIVILIIIAAGILVDIIYVKAKYKKLTTREKYIYQVQKLMKLLSRLKLTPADGETLEEFEKRMENRLKDKNIDSPEFISQYENVIYADGKVTEDMVQGVCDEREKMIKCIVKNSLRVKD